MDLFRPITGVSTERVAIMPKHARNLNRQMVFLFVWSGMPNLPRVKKGGRSRLRFPFCFNRSRLGFLRRPFRNRIRHRYDGGLVRQAIPAGSNSRAFSKGDATLSACSSADTEDIAPVTPAGRLSVNKFPPVLPGSVPVQRKLTISIRMVFEVLKSRGDWFCIQPFATRDPTRRRLDPRATSPVTHAELYSDVPAEEEPQTYKRWIRGRRPSNASISSGAEDVPNIVGVVRPDWNSMVKPVATPRAKVDTKQLAPRTWSYLYKICFAGRTYTVSIIGKQERHTRALAATNRR